jgi:acyl carrier protein phosphodiesterase
MNLLAHALLSGERPGVIVGGVVADWIKGPIDGALEADLAEGVRRHRRVDLFADAHPASGASRGRLRERWGRYSGILVDMAYDFCLAAHWERFGPGSVEEYVRSVHRIVIDFIPRLPETAAFVARRMIADEWMLAGRSWERIGLTLERVSRRLRRPVALGKATDDLRRLEADLASDFLELFPDVVRHVT